MATPDKLNFGLLPERRIEWRTLATSYGIELFFILLLLGAGFFFPDTLRLRQKFTVTELVPRPDLKPEPVKPKAKLRKPVVMPKIAPPVTFPTAKLFVPKDIRTKKKKEEEEKAPQLEAKFKAPELAAPPSAMPAKIVYTGAFGSSAAATLSAPIQKVQTGGFGDPDGLKGQGKDNAHLAAAKLGSFDLPQGQGQGNGSGGANGMKGTVASAGFGNGIAQGDNRNRGGAVQTAGFGAQEVSHNGPKIAQADSGPATTQVEIISKPSPVYTQEARQLKLEGEVLLEVLFGANGQLHVNRVVRGLGHGLDEAAVTAASQMRFKPAQRMGTPVDSTAIVHVVFQLAY
ncbi:MAG TPA: energy transducer TonB [Terriglobales bacterium]|nr:energy transducer TonB [Terriglobales bacterium]